MNVTRFDPLQRADVSRARCARWHPYSQESLQHDFYMHNICLLLYADHVQLSMRALFVELPAFERYRSDYLSDGSYRRLQNELLEAPDSGDLIPGTGGLRKLRQPDAKRGKGKRGGLRVIYFWWESKRQFWLFTLYDKDEMDDLSPKERAALKARLKSDLETRQ